MHTGTHIAVSVNGELMLGLENILDLIVSDKWRWWSY